jgi:hypothetical protein
MGANDIYDDLFGNLTWDGNLLVWLGTSRTDEDASFDVIIGTVSERSRIPWRNDPSWDRSITNASRETFKRIKQSDSLFRIAAAKEFLPLYPRWNDGKSIDANEFEKRLKIDSITLHPGGEAEIGYDDDDMFAGHGLFVHIDSNGAVTRVEMFG